MVMNDEENPGGAFPKLLKSQHIALTTPLLPVVTEFDFSVYLVR